MKAYVGWHDRIGMGMGERWSEVEEEDWMQPQQQPIRIHFSRMI